MSGVSTCGWQTARDIDAYFKRRKVDTTAVSAIPLSSFPPLRSADSVSVPASEKSTV